MQVLTQAASLEDATDVVREYIKFCEENIVPSEIVKMLSDNESWITKELKTTINEKKIQENSGNKMESKLIETKLNKQIRRQKECLSNRWGSSSRMVMPGKHRRVLKH